MSGHAALSRARCLVFALGLCCMPGAAFAGPVDVTVTDVRNARGHIRVAVCDEASFLSANCAYRGEAVAQPGSVTVHFPDVPPGRYAVQAYHDENDNQKLDTSLLGIPKEGMGFSRDAPMHFGPPHFADAALTILPAGAIMSFALRYFD